MDEKLKLTLDERAGVELLRERMSEVGLAIPEEVSDEAIAKAVIYTTCVIRQLNKKGKRKLKIRK